MSVPEYADGMHARTVCALCAEICAACGKECARRDHDHSCRCAGAGAR